MSAGFSRSRESPKEFELQGHGRSSPLNSIYVGFVKAVDDVVSMGRLQVWIPELGGSPTDSNTWYTCSYASPFAGATNIYDSTNDNSTWTNSQRSYGMWFVPPDINNEVLVCFINGDQNRGIWFACLYQQNMNHMVPGIPGNNSSDSLPVVEYNKKGGIDVNNPSRATFSPLADQLQIQGLDQDFLRGVSTSGARRLDPTNAVYGILTPLQNQFVMDDNPGQAFIRLRTRTGTQVLVSDTDGSVYINSADGSSWLNMASDGAVEIYANGDISLRSQGNMNFRADIDVNIEAGRTINMKARNDTLITNPSMPSEEQQAKGGNINIYANRNYNLTASNIYTMASNTHARTAGNIFDTADGPPFDPSTGEKSKWGNIFVKANGNIFINSNSNIVVQSIDNIFLQTSNLIYMDVDREILITANGNITMKSNVNINIESASNLNFEGGNITMFGNMNVGIYSADIIEMSSTNAVTISSSAKGINVLADKGNIVIASNEDVWVSAESNIYIASGIDTTIHTGGMLAEYVHTFKKLQEIHATTEDVVVPDVEPIPVSVDPWDTDMFGVAILKKFTHKETDKTTRMWAKLARWPIQPTDITQVDKQINGPGSYQDVTRDTILYRLPYHEPYAYHSGTLVGTDSYVSEGATGANGLTIDPVSGRPILLGTIIAGATLPMDVVGTPSAGMPPGTYQGIGYDPISGDPLYKFLGQNPALQSGSSYQLSQEGIQFLIGYEGLNPLPYTDLGGQILIGVGHALEDDEIQGRYTNVDGEQIPWLQGLSDSQIMSLLNQDLYVKGDKIKKRPVVPTVQGALSAQVTQAQFDVMVDFCFNVTPNIFQSSDVVQQISAGNFDLAANLLINWNLLNGTVNQQITNRRRDEASRFRGVQTTL